jgi:hypothetical protein
VRELAQEQYLKIIEAMKFAKSLSFAHACLVITCMHAPAADLITVDAALRQRTVEEFAMRELAEADAAKP